MSAKGQQRAVRRSLTTGRRAEKPTFRRRQPTLAAFIESKSDDPRHCCGVRVAVQDYGKVAGVLTPSACAGGAGGGFVSTGSDCPQIAVREAVSGTGNSVMVFSLRVKA